MSTPRIPAGAAAGRIGRGVRVAALAGLLVAGAGAAAAGARPIDGAMSAAAAAHALKAATAATSPASTVTTDSGEPAISWTWTTITPKPGESRGEVLFQRDCAVCHGSGPAKPGTRALRAKYQGKLPALLEQRTDLTAEYVQYIVRHGVSVMPPFRKTEVSEADLDAIAAYLSRKKR